jgi:hypothetical protein
MREQRSTDWLAGRSHEEVLEAMQRGELDSLLAGASPEEANLAALERDHADAVADVARLQQPAGADLGARGEVATGTTREELARMRPEEIQRRYQAGLLNHLLD